jgi:hypothetical protein
MILPAALDMSGHLDIGDLDPARRLIQVFPQF